MAVLSSFSVSNVSPIRRPTNIVRTNAFVCISCEKIRLQDGLDLLIKMPDDPVVLHSVGVGLAHRGIEALKYEDDVREREDVTPLQGTGCAVLFCCVLFCCALHYAMLG